jgi:transposase
MNRMCRVCESGCVWRAGVPGDRLDCVVGFNFLAADLDQGFLLPPDMREWLDPGHLALFIIDAVDQFDLSAFEARYRCDGRGGAAYAPNVMVRLLLFAYCEGMRSSRQIEQRCQRDVAYRVLAGNRCPDHATIARFRNQHVEALPALFVQVLRLCAAAGLVRVGLLALDGTKLQANASSFQNYDAERLERAIGQLNQQLEQMVAEAAQRDAAEDAAGGEGPDASPPELQNRARRLAKLQAAKQRLDAEAAEAQRLQDQRRADWEQAAGRKGPPPGQKPPKRGSGNGKTNLTDPDSRIMRTRDGFKQGFNGQAVVTDDQVIVAAEVVPENTDFDAFHPMLDAARANLDAAGVEQRIRAVAADSGYSNKHNRTRPAAGGDDPVALIGIPPLGGKKPAGWHERKTDPRLAKDPSLAKMAKRLATPAGRGLYGRRKTMVEPVFGQIKQVAGPRMLLRGRAKVNGEWNLMAAAHNLLKCWRHLALQAS